MCVVEELQRRNSTELRELEKPKYRGGTCTSTGGRAGLQYTENAGTQEEGQATTPSFSSFCPLLSCKWPGTPRKRLSNNLCVRSHREGIAIVKVQCRGRERERGDSTYTKIARLLLSVVSVLVLTIYDFDLSPTSFWPALHMMSQLSNSSSASSRTLCGSELGPLHNHYGCVSGCSYGTPNSGSGHVSDSLACSWHPFSPTVLRSPALIPSLIVTCYATLS